MRGYFALAVTGILFFIADAVERTIIVGLLKLRPRSREKILSGWARFMAGLTLQSIQRLGGAQIRKLPQIASGPGVLVLMNHQSLLDIPLVIQCLESGYPKIVTRRRYAKGIPLVSHMLRLYEHPLVDPGDKSRRSVATLVRSAREAHQPLVIFPEGTRTKTGEIGPFMKAGLSGILSVRPWLVYLAVGDGFWRGRRLQEIARNLPRIRGAVETLGPFSWTPGGQSPESFLDEMRDHMCLKINEMRGCVKAESRTGNEAR